MDNNNYGVFLARLRERADLTQRQLAIKMDVAVQTVSNWETGRRGLRLTPQETLRLCGILQCTLEELAGL